MGWMDVIGPKRSPGGESVLVPERLAKGEVLSTLRNVPEPVRERWHAWLEKRGTTPAGTADAAKGGWQAAQQHVRGQRAAEAETGSRILGLSGDEHAPQLDGQQLRRMFGLPAGPLTPFGSQVVIKQSRELGLDPLKVLAAIEGAAVDAPTGATGTAEDFAERAAATVDNAAAGDDSVAKLMAQFGPDERVVAEHLQTLAAMTHEEQTSILNEAARKLGRDDLVGLEPFDLAGKLVETPAEQLAPALSEAAAAAGAPPAGAVRPGALAAEDLVHTVQGAEPGARSTRAAAETLAPAIDDARGAAVDAPLGHTSRSVLAFDDAMRGLKPRMMQMSEIARHARMLPRL